MFVDELDWYQGSGELDKTRLAVATATNVLPGERTSGHTDRHGHQTCFRGTIRDRCNRHDSVSDHQSRSSF